MFIRAKGFESVVPGLRMRFEIHRQYWKSIAYVTYIVDFQYCQWISERSLRHKASIINLCDDAAVIDKSSWREYESSPVGPRRLRRDRAGSVRNASNLFVTTGPDSSSTRHRGSPVPSYSNRIFQEQFSITTTVLTKPFPSYKMHEDGSFFFDLATSQRRRSGCNLEARECRRRQTSSSRGKCEASIAIILFDKRTERIHISS